MDAFKAFEVREWGARAETYELVMGRMTALTHGALLDAAGVRAGVRVLDVATGPGALVAAAAARGADAVGVDLAPEMLARARALHPRLRFELGDAEALPFADASFDAAIAAFVLEHLPDAERAARELARVLRPGGRVAGCVWAAGNPFLGMLRRALDEGGVPKAAGTPAGPSGDRFADESAFVTLLRDAGFVDVRVDELEVAHVAPDAEALWEGMLGGAVRSAARVAAATPEQRAAARAALRRLAGPGGVTLTGVAKLASGRVSSPIA